MRKRNKFFFLRLLRNQSGQTLLWAVLVMTCMLAMSGLVLDIGHTFIAYRELVASTDASALAGAQQLPNSTWSSQATAFSSVQGNNNAFSNLPNVTMATGYPKANCLKTLQNYGEACVAPANANSVQVKQTVTVPTYFLPIVYIPSITLTAESTAAMRGAVMTPYNVAIVLDSTQSMNSTDSDCGGKSRFDCALGGVQTLLNELYPCWAGSTTCTVSKSGVATNPVDQVAIFTFPNITNGTIADEYGCNSSQISVQPYTFPAVPGASDTSGYQPAGSSGTVGNSTPTYQVTSFLSDFRSGDFASSLSTGSDLSIAVGAGSSGSSCEMDSKGGAGTYYAGTIYAAQAALLEMAANNTGSQNVMIIISDGEAQSTNMASTDVNGNAVSTTSGLYPSTIDQCQQAIVAANYATYQGTRVYAVAYGSESSGCDSGSGGTDSSFVLPTSCKAGTNCTAYTKVAVSSITPCWT
ncbi:MAG: pilus assembly protein TadG-related protein, partial [Terracidiphilus sp.]